MDEQVSTEMIFPVSSDKAISTTADDLLPAVRHHALAAREKCQSIDRNVRLDAAIHTGVAVELAAKAVLIALDVRLVCAGNASAHAFLEAAVRRAGGASVSEHTYKAGQTISALLAIELAERLHPDLREHKSAAVAAGRARNGAAHLASLDEGGLSSTVTGMESYVRAATKALGLDLADFLGADEAPWELRIAEREDAIARSARTKIEAARNRFEKFVETVGQDKISELTAFLAGSAREPTGDESVTIDCPACDYEKAVLSWDAEVDVEWDGTVYGGMVLIGLDCPRCRLELDAEELETTDMDIEYVPPEPDWEHGY